ncbi:hypothetical protein ACHAPC_006150 [Botrytis cinerea]
MSNLFPCAHVWFQQTQVGKLPPLYLSSRPSESKLKHMEHHWYQIIQQYRDMPGEKALDIIMLQEELEKGMSREKRIAVQEYVFNVEDPERRAMLEVWLARFPGFMLRTDRLVDFGVADTRKKVGTRNGWQSWLEEWKLCASYQGRILKLSGGLTSTDKSTRLPATLFWTQNWSFQETTFKHHTASSELLYVSLQNLPDKASWNTYLKIANLNEYLQENEIEEPNFDVDTAAPRVLDEIERKNNQGDREVEPYCEGSK